VFKDSKNIPSKLDPIQQAAFKGEYEILEDYLMENEAILFVDGTHPQHNTKPTGVWVLKGKEKIIKSNTGRARLNINGAYNPHKQDLIVREDATIDAQSTIELFKQIETYYPKKKTIYVIADNARYYRNTEVQKYLESSRIKLIFLPPYSPNLNLIERLWRLLYKKIIRTEFYDSFKDFKESVMGFLENLNLHRDEVKKFVGTKLQLLEVV
jgi:hypothetical protein